MKYIMPSIILVCFLFLLYIIYDSFIDYHKNSVKAANWIKENEQKVIILSVHPTAIKNTIVFVEGSKNKDRQQILTKTKVPVANEVWTVKRDGDLIELVEKVEK